MIIYSHAKETHFHKKGFSVSLVFKVMVFVEGDRGAGARENRGQEGYGRWEKKGREVGFLRWREAGEKFKESSFFFLLLLTSSQRNEPNNVSWLPFNVFQGLKQNFIHEKSQKTKTRALDKKNGITSCEIGNLSKSLTS